MDRRKFLNNSIKACASTFLVEQFFTQQHLYGQNALMNAIAGSCNDNILVVVQLFGGNDGQIHLSRLINMRL